MTRFEEFKNNAKSNDDYVKEIEGNGSFEYKQQVKDLIRLQNNINRTMFIYLFGEQLGDHYARKFMENGRNLLKVLSEMDNECSFFLLHELKTNKNLFINQ